MLAKIICDVLQRWCLKAFPWYAFVFYGLEIAAVFVLAIIGMVSGPPEEGAFLVFVCFLYAGFNFWQLRRTLREYRDRKSEISNIQPRTITIEAPRKSFDELAAELKKETDLLQQRLTSSHSGR